MVSTNRTQTTIQEEGKQNTKKQYKNKRASNNNKIVIKIAEEICFKFYSQLV